MYDMPKCQCCGTPIDLNWFRFAKCPENPAQRRAPGEILNKDCRLDGKSIPGSEELEKALRLKTAYAEEFYQFIASITAPPFGLTNHQDIPQNVRTIYDTAANLVLYSWFIREFAAAGILLGYVALEAALKHKYPMDKGKPGLSASLKALNSDQIEATIERELIWQNFSMPPFEESGFGAVWSQDNNLLFDREWQAAVADKITRDRIEAWRNKLNEAAAFRNKLAHGDDDAFLSEATADSAPNHLQFIGELINRVYSFHAYPIDTPTIL